MAWSSHNAVLNIERKQVVDNLDQSVSSKKYRRWDGMTINFGVLPLFADHHIRKTLNEVETPSSAQVIYTNAYQTESTKKYRNMDIMLIVSDKYSYEPPFIRTPTASNPFPVLCKENNPLMKPSYYIWYDEDAKKCMRCDPKSNCKTCQKSQPEVCLTCWGEDILNTEGDNSCMAPSTMIDNNKYLMEYQNYGDSPNDFSAKDILPLKVENAFNDVTQLSQKCGALYIYGGPKIFGAKTKVTAEFKDLNSHF